MSLFQTKKPNDIKPLSLDITKEMFGEVNGKELYNRLASGTLTMTKCAKLLGCSTSTIRNHLESLYKSGTLKRENYQDEVWKYTKLNWIAIQHVLKSKEQTLQKRRETAMKNLRTHWEKKKAEVVQ